MQTFASLVFSEILLKVSVCIDESEELIKNHNKQRLTRLAKDTAPTSVWEALLESKPA